MAIECQEARLFLLTQCTSIIVVAAAADNSEMENGFIRTFLLRNMYLPRL